MSNPPLVSVPHRLLIGNHFIHESTEGCWLSPDDVMALLQTVGERLEGGLGGTRFPLLWRLGGALQVGPTEAWRHEELPSVLAELEVTDKVLVPAPSVSGPL